MRVQDLRPAPSTEIRCGRCATRVLVRKNSLEQTSIQWLDEASRCTEFAEAGDGVPTALRASCESLYETIRGAVRSGQLEVPGENGATDA